MRSFRSIAVAALSLGALTLGACANSSTVQLPDGTTAHDIQCYGGRARCTKEAERICGEGQYIVLNPTAKDPNVSEGQHGGARIQCVNDYYGGRPPPGQSAPTQAAN